MCLIGTVDEGLPPLTIGSQLKMHKGLYIFGVFGTLGNLKYLATKYMEIHVELV